MPRDGTATRNALLDAAQELILDRGYAGTRVDDVLELAGTTKGGFFHHFASKQDLAHALLERFVQLDLQQLEATWDRADELTRDPRERLLVFVGLYRELFVDLVEPFPGCLMGSYVAEAGLFDEHTMRMVEDDMRTWRARLLERIEEVAALHPPRVDVDLVSLADMFTVVIEGAFIVSRVMGEPAVTANQLGHLRTYLEVLFPA